MKKFIPLFLLALMPIMAQAVEPQDNFQARALDHIENAREWAGDADIAITEINVASDSDGRWNELLAVMQEQADEDDVELFGWAVQVWDPNYNVGIFARDNGTWITQETGELWEDRNVNLSALEIGNGYSGDISWAYLEEEDFEFLGDKGIEKVRLPIRWERMSAGFWQGLDDEMKGEVTKYIDWADDNDIEIVLDIHNYGEYKYDGGSYTIEEKEGEYIDFLRKLSSEFSGQGGFGGIDIMNEPHRVSSSEWKSISNNVVNTLRGDGRDFPLYVTIPSWAGVHSIDELAGETWLDNEDNAIYVAHYYPNSIGQWGQWDGTFTGTYDEELASASSYGIDTGDDTDIEEEEEENTDAECMPTSDTATNGGWGWNGTSGCIVYGYGEDEEDEIVEEVITCEVQEARIQDLEGLLNNLMNLINAKL